VDDTMALVSVAEALSPTADDSRVSVIGLSRGGGVALLMGIRDQRVKQVIDFFGPTDFFDTYVQDITEEALNGSLRQLPGLDYLNTSFIQPLKEGTLTIADVRPELIRRSPVLFVDRLPDVQVHHGTADETVNVSQAQSLILAMQAAGRTEPSFEAYIYAGGTHSPFTLENSFTRASEFVSRLLEQ
jgi:dipeptidyl aminopeptidase/acylaminoacyl peptidase